MDRNLVVLADGTGNSAAKLFKTNVWRIYQALDLGGADQLAAFSDGVGTSNFRPFQLIGLALGFGVKRRVLALYKFLCLNYQPGDEIYAFGFSRGAFTIRVLVGLIASEGLVTFKSQEELDRNALAAYRAFRPKAFPARKMQIWVLLSRKIRNLWVAVTNRLTGSRNYDVVRPEPGTPRAPDRIRIRFMGVWDTVSAYGLPVDELTKAVDKWVWPMTFERRNLLPIVDKARQAFSIDDERRTFFPIPWDESKLDLEPIGPAASPRLQQVWFAGSHANVGGGYADDRLAHIPLCWMIAEAAASGLRFKPEIVADYWDYASPTGRLYDSRSGLGVFYRYHPRSSKHLMAFSAPLIDSSVVLRMRDGADAYAPISLPEKVKVLTPTGSRIPFTGSLVGMSVTTPLVDNLPLPAGRRRDLESMEKQLRSALAALQPAGEEADRQERVEQMLDTVWWRRGLYYVMLGLAVLFALFPLLAGYVTLDMAGRIDLVSSGVVGPVAGLLKGFLPGFTAPWIDAIAKHAFLAVLLGAAFATCLWLSSLLKTRIQDRARLAWNVAAEKEPHLASDRRDAQQRVAFGGSLAFGLAALVLWMAGNAAAAWLAFAFIACVAVMFLQRGKATADLPLFLRVARSVRKNPLARTLYNLLREQILPATFLILSLALIAFLLNKVAFQVASSAGATCPKPSDMVENQSEHLAGVTVFRTSSLCHDTGSWVQEGVRYRVSVEITTPWKDGGFPADTLGTKRGSAHYAGSLLKRSWSQPWFKPIARVGRYGNDEYVLHPFQQTLSRGRQGNLSLISEIIPRQSGELYIYLNDAVIGVPGLFNRFYVNNTGEANVSITKAAP